MNKALVATAIVTTAILSPVIGMAIGETRSFILGLAPEEAVLQLADKIDEQRIAAEQAKAENDKKTEALQSTVAQQQMQLTVQQQMIDAQEKANAENKRLQECQVLQKKVGWCSDEQYRLPLDTFIKEKKAENPPAMENDDVVAGAKKDWEVCQTRYQEYVTSGCN